MMNSGRKSPGTWNVHANELILCELSTCSSRLSLELIRDLGWDSLETEKPCLALALPVHAPTHLLEWWASFLSKM